VGSLKTKLKENRRNRDTVQTKLKGDITPRSAIEGLGREKTQKPGHGGGGSSELKHGQGAQGGARGGETQKREQGENLDLNPKTELLRGSRNLTGRQKTRRRDGEANKCRREGFLNFPSRQVKNGNLGEEETVTFGRTECQGSIGQDQARRKDQNTAGTEATERLT